MDDLDDFMLFNACEDAREEAEREGTKEYPYCKQFFQSSIAFGESGRAERWEDKEEKSSYWDDDKD